MKGWQTRLLGDVLIPCGTIDPTKSPDRQFQYVDVSSVSNETFEIVETQSLKGRDAPSRARRLIRTGDVLFATIRPTLKRVAMVPARLDGEVCSTGYFVFRTKPFLDGKFLFFYLFSEGFMGAMERLQTGASYPAVNDSQVKGEQISFPPLPEQRRIVSILDEAFAGLDAMRANAEKNLQNARDLFDSYLNAIFTEKGDGWVERNLEEFISITHGFAFDGSDFEVSSDEAKPIVLTPGNYSDGGELYFNLKNTKRFIGGTLKDGYLFNAGDLTIVMTDLSSKMKILGKPAFVERTNLLHNQRIGRVFFKNKVILPRLLYYYLRTEDYSNSIKATSTGTMVRHTAPKRILAMNIAAPEAESDQVALVERLDGLELTVNLLESLYRQKLAAIDELKQSILQKAFAGELTANEPAILAMPKAAPEFLDTVTPKFTAQVLAFSYHRHAAKSRDKTFGRVKAQKALHLTESVAGVDLGRQPVKDAAGPNDFPHMLRAEEWARAQGFFEFVARTEGGYEFKKLANFDNLLGAAMEAVTPYKDQILKVLNIVIPLDSRDAEVLATVHAAWNNLILDGVPIDDRAIIHAAREGWHASKMDIPEFKFGEAIRSIRRLGIVPDGSAKRVGGQEQFPLI